MKNKKYDDVLNRMGYFMNKANLSARQTSLRLGYSEQFMKRLFNKTVELKVSTLLDFMDLVEITPQDFFYLGKEYNKQDKNVLDMFNSLSIEGKETIINLMKQIK